MNLAEIAETVPARQPGLPCSVDAARARLGSIDQVTLDGYLTARTPMGRWVKSGQWVADLLNRALDIDLKSTAVGHHRRGACRCRCRR